MYDFWKYGSDVKQSKLFVANKKRIKDPKVRFNRGKSKFTLLGFFAPKEQTVKGQVQCTSL